MGEASPTFICPECGNKVPYLVSLIGPGEEGQACPACVMAAVATLMVMGLVEEKDGKLHLTDAGMEIYNRRKKN